VDAGKKFRLESEASTKKMEMEIPEYNRKMQETEKPRNFLRECLRVMSENYHVGNDKTIEGYKETQVYVNQKTGEIASVQLSPKFYDAKGCFEKMTTALNMLDESGIDDNFELVKQKLLKAAEIRMESIDLVTRGSLLNEPTGKISTNNAIAIVMKDGETLPLPEYHDEQREALTKIKIANSYIVEAVKLCKQENEEYKKNKVELVMMDYNYIDTLSYYSEVNEASFDTYVSNGDNFLELKNYCESIIQYNLALRVKPDNKKVLLKLMQARIGRGETIDALDILTNRRWQQLIARDND
jgi:hypothetical protein